MNELMFLLYKKYEDAAYAKFGEKAVEAAQKIRAMEKDGYDWGDDWEEDYIEGQSFDSATYDEEGFANRI